MNKNKCTSKHWGVNLGCIVVDSWRQCRQLGRTPPNTGHLPWDYHGLHCNLIHRLRWLPSIEDYTVVLHMVSWGWRHYCPLVRKPVKHSSSYFSALLPSTSSLFTSKIMAGVDAGFLKAGGGGGGARGSSFRQCIGNSIFVFVFYARTLSTDLKRMLIFKGMTASHGGSKAT